MKINARWEKENSELHPLCKFLGKKHATAICPSHWDIDGGSRTAPFNSLHLTYSSLFFHICPVDSHVIKNNKKFTCQLRVTFAVTWQNVLTIMTSFVFPIRHFLIPKILIGVRNNTILWIRWTVDHWPVTNWARDLDDNESSQACSCLHLAETGFFSICFLSFSHYPT